MPRIRFKQPYGCSLGPTDICMNCYDDRYSGRITIEGPDYGAGYYECMDCGTHLTRDDDPYYRPPQPPLLMRLITLTRRLLKQRDDDTGPSQDITGYS